jgi:2-phosphosulfolactate phosphatase
LRGGVAVVVDVLRATTVMVQALAAGCEALVPCAEIKEAEAVAASLPTGSALRAGERQGLPIEGFDLGNSPGDFTPEVCRGKTLVMTTTNGTRAILASLDADAVLIAAFTNLGATVTSLRDARQATHVVCAGTDGQVSWEDALLAGALVSELDSHEAGNDAARIVRAQWGHAWTVGAPGTPGISGDDAADLFALLREGRGGRRVHEIGLEPDIREAARIDRHRFTVRLRREPLRIVRGAE